MTVSDDVTRAAESGDADAQFALGLSCFDYDLSAALAWYKKAADQGHAYAQFELGRYAADDNIAASWFKKSAAQDNQYAQLALANMYWAGKGVSRDDAEALAWCLKAAEQLDQLLARIPPSSDQPENPNQLILFE